MTCDLFYVLFKYKQIHEMNKQIPNLIPKKKKGIGMINIVMSKWYYQLIPITK